MDGVVREKFSQPFTEREVAADWRARGFSCGRFVEPPGRAWNDFVHHTNELVTVAEGRLEMTIAGNKIVVEPGDEVFIPRINLRPVWQTIQWVGYCLPMGNLGKRAFLSENWGKFGEKFPSLFASIGFSERFYSGPLP